MSLEASREQKEGTTANGNGNGSIVLSMRPSSFRGSQKLKKNPEVGHRSDNYEDLQLEFSPLLYSSLERYLPQSLLNAPREVKIQYMRQILSRYSPEGERQHVRIAKLFGVISLMELCIYAHWYSEFNSIKKLVCFPANVRFNCCGYVQITLII